MRTIVALLRASHPEPVVVIAAVMGALALTAGRGVGTVWVVLAVLAGQLFIGWSNDYVDRERDIEAGRSDKPIAAGRIDPRVVGASAVAALAATVPLSLASGVSAAVVHLAALAAGTAYNLGLKRTAFSAFLYAIGFGLLPAFVTLGLVPSRWPPVWVLLAAALIGVGGHFAQARPDVEQDRVQGVLGLPQLAGAQASAIVAALFLAAGAAVIAAGAHAWLPLVAILPLPAVVIASPRLAYRLTLLIAVLTVGALLISGRSVGA